MKYMLLNLCVYFPPINLSFVTGAIGQKILKGSGKNISLFSVVMLSTLLLNKQQVGMKLAWRHRKSSRKGEGIAPL